MFIEGLHAKIEENEVNTWEGGNNKRREWQYEIKDGTLYREGNGL